MPRFINANPASHALARAQDMGMRDIRLDLQEEARARQRWRDSMDMDTLQRSRNLDAAIREAYQKSWAGGMEDTAPEPPVSSPGGGGVPAHAGALALATPPAPAGMGPFGGGPGAPSIDPVMQALAGVEGGSAALMQREGVVSQSATKEQERIDEGLELVIGAIGEGNDAKADAFARHYGLADQNGNWHPKIAPMRGRPDLANGINLAKDLGYEGPQVGLFIKSYSESGSVATAMAEAGMPYAPKIIEGMVDGESGQYAVDPNFPDQAQPITVQPDAMGGSPLKVMPKGGGLTAVQQSRNKQIMVAREILESQGWLNDPDGLRRKTVKGIETWSLQEEYDPTLRAVVDLATKRLYGEDPDYDTRWAALGLSEGPNAEPELPVEPAAAPPEEDTGPGWIDRQIEWMSGTESSQPSYGDVRQHGADRARQMAGDGAAGTAPAEGATAPGDEAAQLQQQVRDAAIEGTPIAAMTWEQMHPYIIMDPRALRERFTDGQLVGLEQRMMKLAEEQRAAGGQPISGGP